MCDPLAGFKLCSCEGEQLADPDWVLRRLDSSKPACQRRGRAIPPKYSSTEEEYLDQVVSALDAGECFDFDYAPHEGDVLILKRDSTHYRFRYTRRWAIDRSTALAGWRTQMVLHDQGRLAKP